MPTNFQAVNDADIIKNAYLYEKILKINSHLSLLEEEYNEIKLEYYKQPVEKILIQWVDKKTIQLLYDKGLFDNYANADSVFKIFCLLQGVELIERK